MTQGEHQVE
jgi:hypothetical protein